MRSCLIRFMAARLALVITLAALPLMGGCEIAPFKHRATLTVFDKATNSPAANVRLRVYGECGENFLFFLWPSDVIAQTDGRGQARVKIPNWDVGGLDVIYFPDDVESHANGFVRLMSDDFGLNKSMVKEGGDLGGNDEGHRYLVTLQPGWPKSPKEISK